MPIGDPMGGESYDLGRGKLKRVWMVKVPVNDLKRAVDWYTGALGLGLVHDRSADNWVEVGLVDENVRIVLFVPDPREDKRPGTDTGIIFATDSIFEVHRRLVDEGVDFIIKPERQAWGGLMAVFLDPFGNKLGILEESERPS